ncbi:MAG: ribonuclease Z [Bacteroidales bacterium]|nr:ribonuclease Z [Bacteroidales bacterium]
MSFKLTVLGANSALPTSDKFSTAQLLQVAGRSFLLDCAEGTQMQLRKNRVNFESIRGIFITHLHGDHIFGIFGLLSSFNLLGRRNHLSLFGPKGIKSIINNFFISFDVKLNFTFEITEIQTNDCLEIYRDKAVSVSAVALLHRIETYGYIFRESLKDRNIRKEAIIKYSIPLNEIHKIKKGADFIADDGSVINNADLTVQNTKSSTYAFITDTAYNENIIKHIKSVDVLYHEATFLEQFADRAKETFHSTARQAATIAKQAQVGKLLLGHYSARTPQIEKFKAEAIEIFLNTECATDGTTLEF